MLSLKARQFWPVAAVLLLTDCATKELAVEHLPPYSPQEVVGDLIRVKLAFNPGAAMGLSLGPFSRPAFTLIALGTLFFLLHLYRQTDATDKWRAAALGLVFGGAVGNLADRVRSPRGVVDFIDVGLGGYRFWTFNLADAGVTVGALALAWLLWREKSARDRGTLGR